MKNLYAFIICCSFSALVAQPVLKPTIGLSALPADNDPVCSIPVYNDPSGDFSASGFFVGDTIPHFQLYDRNGVAYDIAQILSQNKPVLLVAGNLTCPIFRNYIDSINTYQTLYGNVLNIYVVYGVEAHPKSPDVSPYSGNVWVTSQNINQNYLYNQPTTYKKRKNLVDTLMVRDPVNVPILIDGPCNEWWLNFGPAPNNAYLIKPDGVVAVKNGWFINPPQEWRNDIDSVLSVLSVKEKTNETSFEIFPNPCTDAVTIKLSEEHASYTITDLAGRKILNGTFVAGNNTVSTDTMERGLYFITIESEKNRSGKIFIKE
jgi:hypothetical protein